MEKVSFGRGLETVLKRFGRSWEHRFEDLHILHREEAGLGVQGKSRWVRGTQQKVKAGGEESSRNDGVRVGLEV